MGLSKQFFDNIPSKEAKDIAYNLVASLREAISIAQNDSAPPSYADTIRLIHDIDPALHEFCTSQLAKESDTELIRRFKELALAESKKRGKELTALELLKKEREEKIDLQKQLKKGSDKSLSRYITSLEAAISDLTSEKLSEHRILERDFYLADRSWMGALDAKTTNTISYKLDDRRHLQIRLLHPDRPEHLTGADLIYEQLHSRQKIMRIVLLQYKTWNDNGILYFSSPSNLGEQLSKLNQTVCQRNLCSAPSETGTYKEFRFPYCSAFLRPTDKQQDKNYRLLSSGIHIPICAVLKMQSEGHFKLEKKKLPQGKLSHEVFESLFTKELLGSRWLSFSEVEAIYRQQGVLNNEESLKLYVQEILD